MYSNRVSLKQLSSCPAIAIQLERRAPEWSPALIIGISSCPGWILAVAQWYVNLPHLSLMRTLSMHFLYRQETSHSSYGKTKILEFIRMSDYHAYDVLRIGRFWPQKQLNWLLFLRPMIVAQPVLSTQCRAARGLETSPN